MRKIFSAYFMTLFIIWTQNISADEDSKFTIEKSSHFIIKYRCDKQFVEQVRKYAELYYDKIETDLELNRFANFWTWDNRCTIILYSSHDEYISVTRQPEWSGGHVDYKNRVIYSFPWAENFLESLLPHELTHIIFREYIDDNQRVPLWIDEGLAQYEEQADNPNRTTVLEKSIRNGIFIKLNDLQKISVLHNNSTDDVVLFYAQSESIISFMIHKFAKKKFAEFVRQLKSGKNVSQALRFTYVGTIDTVAKLEKKWLEFVQ